MIIHQELKKIQLLVSQHQFAEAEMACLNLQQQYRDDIQLTQLLSQIYIKTNRMEMAVELLRKLFLQHTSNRQLCDYLASLYGKLKKFEQACFCYLQYLLHNPSDSDALYNLAFNQRHAGEFEEALRNYQLALNAQIAQPEEVMLNMAVIYSDHLNDHLQAEKLLKKALQINFYYVPAIFNLANLFEQSGDRINAEKLFKRILSVQSNHYDSLARLADLKVFSDLGDPLIKQMQDALNCGDLNASCKIELLYALGKALNDCKEYALAFEYYQQANTLNSYEQIPYNPKELEAKIDRIIQTFSNPWHSSTSASSEYQPVFICGMFRSGSTLIEQILAAHPAINAGGELDFFVRKAANELSPFPEKVKDLNSADFQKLEQEYVAYIKQRFPQDDLITDKRPDNFLFIGLILNMFPKAKIIFTERHPLDNCLSVYFQHLGQSMTYATNLAYIGHFYSQQKKLMTHWRTLFPNSIFTCNYEELVKQPENTIRSTLRFLELEWSPDCLNFYQLKNQVKTASVWQVRKPIYSTSSGRWQNYKNCIEELIKHFGDNPPY